MKAEYRTTANILGRAMFSKPPALSFDNKRTGIAMENNGMPALKMLEALGVTIRVKFIDMRHEYIKVTIQKKDVKLKRAPSVDLKADMFTRFLDTVKYKMMKEIVTLPEILNLDNK